MSKRKTIAIFLSTAALCAPTAAQAGPVGHTAATCSVSGKERKLGTTYVTSLSASGVSCTQALTFVKAYHACRHKHGADGKCPHLQGYTCTEKRASIPTQYDSRASCRRGSRKITHVYTQNT